MKRRIHRYLIQGAALIAALVTGCDLFGEPQVRGDTIDGKVLEEGSEKPIPGAIVIVRWAGTVGAIGHSSGICYHVESAISDAQGIYRTPAWKKPSPYGDITHPRRGITAYHRGYAYSREQDGVVYLKLFSGTREEGLMRLGKIVETNACDEAGKTRKQLYPLYEAVYEEAKGLVTSPADETLKWFRRQAAYAWISKDEPMTQREADRLIDEHLRDHLK